MDKKEYQRNKADGGYYSIREQQWIYPSQRTGKSKKPPKLSKNAEKNKKRREAIEYRKKLPYIEFLKTNYWKRVREKVLLRDGKKCIICGDTKYLQVHHDHYKNHGDEMRHLEDLMTLCRKCHKEHPYAQK